MSFRTSDALIIGGGVSGLAAASDLALKGKSVQVVEKGEQIGGRAMAPRFSDGTIYDSGAQYFTATGERFKSLVSHWLAEPDSTLAAWNRGYPIWEDGNVCERAPGHPRYAPIAGMSRLANRLIEANFAVETGISISSVHDDAGEWIAVGSDNSEGSSVTFSARLLVLALPPNRLLQIAAPCLPAEILIRLEAIRYAPAWTLAVRLQEDIRANWPALELRGHPILGWIARDHTKRRDAGASPVLVAHANAAWSDQNRETDADTVEASLLAAIAGVIGEPLRIAETRRHYWESAGPIATFGAPFWYDRASAFACCGDAFGGNRLESALTSGWSLAEEILRHATGS